MIINFIKYYLFKSHQKCLNYPPFNPKNGFSLIELLVVIAIVGILAGIGSPAIIHAIPDYRLKSAARDLYSTMQKARLLAIKTNRNHAVVFNVPGNTYQIFSAGPDYTWATGFAKTAPVALTGYGSGIGFGWGAATTDIPGGAFPNGAVSYNNPLIMTFNTNVVFNPRGQLNVMGGYVYLSNNQNNSYSVGTPTIIGTIRIQRWWRTPPMWDQY